MKRILINIITILISIIVFSCEDPVPTDYIRQNILEAYLIVDEPIRGLRLMKTLPIQDTFSLDKSLIADAEVYISEGNTKMKLEFNPFSSDFPGYFFPDSNYLVKSETLYELEIKLSDGSNITAKTYTPPRSRFIQKVPDMVYYPIDTLKLPSNDSLKVEWESVPGFGVYGLTLRCLDTLGYGKYLDPPRPEELNRRILKPWSDDNDFYELTNWYPVPNTSSPVVWSGFKYFGKHELAIYVPDYNFLRWFLQNATRGVADELLNSVEGNGFGCFGSVSILRDTSFLVKNQP